MRTGARFIRLGGSISNFLNPISAVGGIVLILLILSVFLFLALNSITYTIRDPRPRGTLPTSRGYVKGKHPGALIF
jgi:hypothetical protein